MVSTKTSVGQEQGRPGIQETDDLTQEGVRESPQRDGEAIPLEDPE